MMQYLTNNFQFDSSVKSYRGWGVGGEEEGKKPKQTVKECTERWKTLLLILWEFFVSL